MIDYAFLFFITLFAIFTPIESEYRKINLILAGKFAIFIGLHQATLGLGLYDGAYVDMYRMILDLAFMGLFLMVGGFYLAFLCLSMAIFHVFNIFFIYDYTLMMIGFQILQLMAASWGVIDGIDCRICSNHSRRHINHH